MSKTAVKERPTAERLDAVLLGAPLELKAEKEGGLPAKFSGIAYSGGYVADYGVVIDMASTTYKQRMPLLDHHMRFAIIGVIEQAATNDQFQMVVGGKLFSDIEGSEAKRIAEFSQRGVPYEMSVGLYGYTREYVPSGKSIQVNGQTFNGPVTVLRNGQVRETSIVTLGADPRTESKFFDLPSGEDPMTTQTVEQLQAQVAQLTAQAATQEAKHQTELAAARAEGAKAELERIKGVGEAVLPGHEALVLTLQFDGKTSPGEAALQVMKAERARLDLAVKEHQQDAPAPVPTGGTPAVTPPKQGEKTDQQKADEVVALAAKEGIDPLLAAQRLGYAG